MLHLSSFCSTPSLVASVRSFVLCSASSPAEGSSLPGFPFPRRFLFLSCLCLCRCVSAFSMEVFVLLYTNLTSDVSSASLSGSEAGVGQSQVRFWIDSQSGLAVPDFPSIQNWILTCDWPTPASEPPKLAKLTSPFKLGGLYHGPCSHLQQLLPLRLAFAKNAGVCWVDREADVGERPVTSSVRHLQSYVEAKNFHILTNHKPPHPIHEDSPPIPLQGASPVLHLAVHNGHQTHSGFRQRRRRRSVEDNNIFSDAVNYHLVSSEQRQDASMTPRLEEQTSLNLESQNPQLPRRPLRCLPRLPSTIHPAFPPSAILRRISPASRHPGHPTPHLQQSRLACHQQRCSTVVSLVHQKPEDLDPQTPKSPLQNFPIPDERF
ncbi:hypothetical protein C7M84_018439 [Penaeus vannamei]|uniref:Uncharacterized protein n=1 Tax=Penaeus vannamei TaxID=6689 RepID=A0A423SHE6_PENVA|nr:hypothetical protein C7M84_018439 [Penaeus vannamei]